MTEETRHNITARIADVTPFKLLVSESEESFYRYIIEQLNKLWTKIHYGAGGVPSEVALAKVALYFAEMYYRKASLAKEQAEALVDFEKKIDDLLREMEL